MSRLTDAIKAKNTKDALDLIRGTSIYSRTYRRAFELLYGNLLEAPEAIPNRALVFAYGVYDFLKLRKYNYLTDDNSEQYGHTPLQLAAQNGLIRVVKRLIRRKVAVERSLHNTNTFYTPKHLTSALHLAVKGGHNKIARMLISAGANLNAYAITDLSCFGLSNIVSYRSSVAATVLYSAVATCELKTIRKLISRGAEINQGIRSAYATREEPEENGIGSILLNAVAHDKVDIIEFLLQQPGIKKNACISHEYITKKNHVAVDIYYTALSMAIKRHQDEIAKILIQYGAKIGLEHRVKDDDIKKRALELEQELSFGVEKQNVPAMLFTPNDIVSTPSKLWFMRFKQTFDDTIANVSPRHKIDKYKSNCVIS